MASGPVGAHGESKKLPKKCSGPTNGSRSSRSGSHNIKSDFAVAPVHLKDVARIQGLLGVYFLALLAQTLLERELRQAMQRAGVEHLPLYAEQRDCRRPTARKVFDAFEFVQRHMLSLPNRRQESLLTQLSPLQRQILKLMSIPAATYGH